MAEDEEAHAYSRNPSIPFFYQLYNTKEPASERTAKIHGGTVRRLAGDVTAPAVTCTKFEPHTEFAIVAAPLYTSLSAVRFDCA